ncbi:MAG: DNA-directed RNA polymerase subunit D [Methanobacteriota archaeon]|nr:MAG: DNA-directed RNA polymerase subunit D [Euryarchaeota archaeon]
MEITKACLDGEKLEFEVKDVPLTFLNTLRRTILSEVPTLAIDEVVIYKNSSVMDDETLAHRLGLIPLRTDLDVYLPPESCDCGGEGCSRCTTSLTLRKKGPATVYSQDLIPEDPRVTPVDPMIPIVRLDYDQELEFEAIARLGRGKNHAKHQPVSVCSYKIIPRIVINQELCDLCGECVQVCPPKTLIRDENRVVVSEPMSCVLCNACVEACRENAITIETDTNHYLFRIEGTGVLPPDKILDSAINILREKTEKLREEIEALGE